MADNFNASDETASIYVEAILSTRKLSQQLQQLKSSTSYTLDFKVNDSRLTDLNKHLDLKILHRKQVQADFDRNPLKPRIDDSNLKTLNNSLSALDTRKINLTAGFDSLDITRELSDIKKELQAQRLNIGVKANLDTEGLKQQLSSVLTSGNNTLTLKIKESTRSSQSSVTSSSEVVASVRSVERAIKENKKGVLGTIGTGLLEGTGSILSKSIVSGLKQDLGLDVNSIARPFTKFVAKPLSKVTPENVQAFEDALVDSLESLFVFNDSAGFKSKIKKAFEPAVNEVKEQVLEGLSEPLYALAQPFRIRKRVQLAASAREAQKRANKIVLTPEEIERAREAQSLAFITGGINYEKGGVNTDFAENLVKRILPGALSVPVRNPWSNDKDTLGAIYKATNKEGTREPMPLDKLLQVGIEKGYNPDSIDMAARVLAYRKQLPDIPAVLAGTSGGSYVAEEALSILQRAGQKNIKGLGITAPFAGLTGTAKPGTFTANVGDLDPLYAAMFGGKGIANPDSFAAKETLKEISVKLPGLLNPKKSSYNRVVPDAGLAHALLPFLANEAFQENVKTHLGSTIGDLNPDYAGQAGIRNLDALRVMGDEKATIPRTLKAIFGNKSTLKQIENAGFSGAEGYTFAVPQKLDWRRDNDFRSMMKGDLNKKGKRATGEAKELFDEYATFLKGVEKGLTEYLDTGGVAKGKLIQVLDKAVKLYPELADIQKQVVKQASEYARLVDLSTTSKAYDARTPRQRQQDVGRLNRLEAQGYTLDNLRTNQSTAKVVEPVLQKQAFTEQLESVKAITEAFQEAYATIKTDLKNKEPDKATTTAKFTLENIARAKQDIETSREGLGIAKIGTSEASKVNQMLGQLSQVEKNIKQQFAKAKIALPTIEVKGIGKEVGAGLAVELQQAKPKVEKASEDLAFGVIKQAKETLKIESPSKVFREIGGFVVEGFEQGLSSLGSVSPVFQEFIATTTSSLGSFGSGLWANAADSTKDFIGNVVKLGGAFGFVTQLLPSITSFIRESSKIATELENIDRQVSFSVGGGSQGSRIAQSIRQNAKDLRVDLKSTLEGSSGFFAATNNTSLEGEQSLEILQNFNTLLASRSVDNQRQARFMVAIEQMASKGIQSEELRGQASEAVPGFYNIYARSQGLNAQQLAKKLKGTPGGLSPETLIAASQQAKAESLNAIPQSLESSQAAVNRLDNSVLELQEKVGQIFLPLQKLNLNAAAAGLDVLAANLGTVVKFTTFLTLWATKPLWLPIIKGTYTWIASLNLASLSVSGLSTQFSTLGKSLSGMASALKPVLAQFLLFETVINLVGALKNQFTDLSGEIGSSAKQAEQSLKLYKKSLNNGKSLSSDNVNNPIDKFKKDFSESPIKALFGYTALGNIAGFDNNKDNKVASDSVAAIKKILKASETTVSLGSTADINNKITTVVDIDKQLASIQEQRRASIQLNPNDTATVKALETRQSDLIAKRYENVKPVAGIQAELGSRSQALKSSQKVLDDLRSAGTIFDDAYAKGTEKIKEQQKAVEALQESIRKSIGKNATAFDFFKQSIEETSAALADAKLKIDATALNQKTALNNSADLTSGNRQYLGTVSDINSLASQIKASQSFIAQQQTLFSSPTAQNTLSSFKVNDSTGINQLKYLSSNAESEQSKYILEQYANLKQSKLDLGQLQNQLSQQRLEVQNNLKDLTRQVADYYTGIVRSAKESKIEFEKQLNTIKTTNFSTKLKEAIGDTEDSFLNSFVDNLVSQIELTNQIANSKLDEQSSKLQSSFKLEDSIKAGSDLSRTLPSKLEISLDLTNVEELNTGLTQAEQLTGLLNSGTTELNKILNSNIISTNKLLTGFENSDNTVKNLTGSTTSWSSSIAGIPSLTSDIAQNFTGIQGVINNIVTATGSWLSGLTQGGSLLGSLVNTASSLLGGGAQQLASPEGIQGLLGQGLSALGVGKPINTGKFRVIDSSTGANIQDVNQISIHHPSRGANGRRANRDYEQIDGRLEEVRRSAVGNLIKKDFVLYQGNNKDVGVPAPASGRAKVSNSYGKVAILDDAGNLIGQVLHLRDIKVKSGDFVQYGQPIGTQSGTGAAGRANEYPIHTHIEATKERLQAYVKDLNDGLFDGALNAVPFQGLLGKGKSLSSNANNSRAMNTSNNSGTGGKYANKLNHLSPQFLQATAKVAESLGTAPENLLAVMGFETGGTYSPSKTNSLGYTGLIQFSPKYSPGNIGKTTGQLRGMGQLEQLQYVAPYIRKNNSRNKSLSSLEDLYMSVLMPSHIGKSPDSALPQWAYKANSGLDIDKDGKISISEATQKVRDYLPNSQTKSGLYAGKSLSRANNIVSLSRANKFASPDSLQNTVDFATDLNNQTIQQQQAIQQKQQETETKKQQAELLKRQEAQLKLFRRDRKETASQSLTSKRQITDIKFNSEQIKDPLAEFQMSVTRIVREYDDNIKERKESIEKITERIKKSQELLKVEGVSDEEKKLLTGKITDDTKLKSQLSGEIATLDKYRNVAVGDAKKLYDRQEFLNRQQQDFELTNQNIQKLRQRLESLKVIQQTNPLDVNVLQIPEIEKTLALKESDLELDRQIAAIQDQVSNKKLTNARGNQQIEGLKQVNLAKQESIELTYQQAKAEQELRVTLQSFENRSKVLEFENNLKTEQIRANDLLLQRNPLLVTNNLELQRESQLQQQLLEYEKARFDILQLKKQGYSEEQIANQLGLLGQLNNQKVSNINNQYSADLETRKVRNLESVASRQQTLNDFVNTPLINRLNLEADKTRRTGNVFVGNATSRKAARIQELSRYQQETLDFDAKVGNLKLQGIEVDEEQIKSVRENLSAIHSLNFENINQQFKSFGETLNDVGRNSIQGFASGLADLIAKGGSLEDVFDNLFTSVLSGFLTQGLTSGLGGLFGGLFYRGGIVPNYAKGKPSDSITSAMIKERAESGRNPILAVVHEGEMMIPAWRVNQLEQLGLGQKELLGYSRGGVAGDISRSMSNSATNSKEPQKITVESTVINNVEYVTIDQFKQGLTKAAEAGGNKGLENVRNKMQGSISFRRSVGI